MNNLKEKLFRCGYCGDFSADPTGYTDEEIENAELNGCGRCGREINAERITRDMAIDAGDLSLEGQWL